MLARLVGVRSQRATEVLAWFEAMATALDLTPWRRRESREEGARFLRASEAFVEPSVFVKSAGAPRPAQDKSPDRGSDRPSPFEELEAPLHEIPSAGPDRERVRWRQALRGGRRRLVVKGAPGGGKTFLGRHTVAERLQQAWARLDAREVSLDEQPVSLFVTATAFANAPGPDAIGALISATAEDFPVARPAIRAASWLRRALASPASLVVIDALDEVAADRRAAFVARATELNALKTQVVVTCRTMAWPGWKDTLPWPTVHEIEIAPFSVRHQRDVARRFFRSDHDAAVRLQRILQTNYALRESCRTPLLLTFACLLHEEGAISEDTARATLYGGMVRKLLEGTWRRRPGGGGDPVPVRTPWANDDIKRTQAVEVLEATTWSLFQKTPASNRFTWRDWDSLAAAPSSAIGITSRDFLKELVDVGLFVRAPDNRVARDCWSFAHRSMLEYLAACGLARLPQETWLAETKQHFRLESEWIETLTHLAAVVDDATPLIAAVIEAQRDDDIFRSMLYLRARLVGVARHCSKDQLDSAVEAAANWWSSTLEPPWSAFSDWTRPVLSALSASPSPGSALAERVGSVTGYSERSAAIEALSTIHNPRAVDPLLAALRDDSDARVRGSAAEALGALAYPRAVDPLLVALRDDPDQFVRWCAADALGAVGDPRAVDPLLVVLRDNPDAGIRGRAANALGAVGDPRAVDPLLVCLRHDPDADVRGRSANALSALGDPRTLDPLLVSLRNDPDADVRVQAAAVGGDFGDPRAVDPLLAALRDDSDARVRGSTAEALGALGDPRAVDPLLVALRNDPDENARASAAGALGALGDPRAVDPLLVTLRDDPDENARKGAAGALGALGDPRAVDPLLVTLRDDPDDDVRCCAAYAFGALGDPRAVDPLLVALRDQSKHFVRWGAADALAALGERRAVDPLLVALRDDPDEGVRSSAATALGVLGERRAVDPLLVRFHDDPAWSVRASAAIALGALGERRALDPLLFLLQHDREGVLPEIASRALWQIVTRHRIHVPATRLRVRTRSPRLPASLRRPPRTTRL